MFVFVVQIILEQKQLKNNKNFKSMGIAFNTFITH